MRNYTVVVIDLITNKSEAVTVYSEGIRDAALSAAGAPDSDWSEGISA